MKYVIVTGAGQGIGAQIAKDLDKLGFNIILMGRNQEKLLFTAQSLTQESIVLPFDLANFSDESSLEETIDNLNGTIHGLINNAGIFIRKTLEETSSSDWNDMFTINLLGPSLLINKILPKLKESDAEHKFIINISSTAAERPVHSTGAYGGLKLALTHITKVLALELAEHKICVNAISPGIIDTPIHSIGKLPQADQEMYQKLQPLGRIGQPNDISSMVSFLSGKQSNWITGSNYIIDGGLSLA